VGICVWISICSWYLTYSGLQHDIKPDALSTNHTSNFHFWSFSEFTIWDTIGIFFLILGFEPKNPVLALQTLYSLSHALSWFCFSYFSDRVSLFALNSNPPIYASHVAWITGSNHPVPAYLWDGILAKFLPGLTLNFKPPNLHLLSSWDYS
jgi:hypothetical protein